MTVTDHASSADRRNELSEQRRLPIGAEVFRDGGTHVRVWAPKRTGVEVVFEHDAAPTLRLTRDDDAGHFSGFSFDARAGMLYRFRLDGGDDLHPDPASRSQPQGVH